MTKTKNKVKNKTKKSKKDTGSFTTPPQIPYNFSALQTPPPPPNKFSFFWKIVVGFSVILAIAVGVYQLKDYFKTSKEKYESSNFDSGILKMPALNGDSVKTESSPIFTSDIIQDSFPLIKGIWVKDLVNKKEIYLKIGSNVFAVKPFQLYQGINLAIGFIYLSREIRLFLGAKDDRVYVNLEFKDLQTEQIIGWIEYNHWKVFLPNTLIYNYDDYKLEVKDKQNNIVLALKYNQDELKPEIRLGGYFIGPTSVLVIPNDDVDGTPESIPKSNNEWKQEALQKIQHIKTIFP